MMTEGILKVIKIHIIQLNLSTMATLAGQKKMAIVESLKQEWTYGLSAETKMAVVERWPLVETGLLLITERRDLI